MRLVKRISIKVNKDCINYLDFSSEQCRILYNYIIAEKSDYFFKTGNSIPVFELKKELPELKKKFPKMSLVYNKCLSKMYFRAKNAYYAFYNGDAKKPKYKRNNKFISQEYPKYTIKIIDEHRFILPTGKNYEKNFIVRTEEIIPSNFTSLSIQKNHIGYFVCFITEVEEKPKSDNKDILAIDLGYKTLVSGITNKSEIVIVDKFSHYTKHLDTIKSKRDSKNKDSNKWRYYNEIYWRELNKYQNRVKDYMHKSSHYITSIRSEGTIIVGDLYLKNMIKDNAPWVNRMFQNEWRVGQFVEMLEYKCNLNGKTLIKIDERNTTKTCSNCGKLHDMSLNDRVYKCECGLVLDRDINSSINILKKYKRMANARGANGLPVGVPNPIEMMGNLNITKFCYV